MAGSWEVGTECEQAIGREAGGGKTHCCHGGSPEGSCGSARLGQNPENEGCLLFWPLVAMNTVRENPVPTLAEEEGKRK